MARKITSGLGTFIVYATADEALAAPEFGSRMVETLEEAMRLKGNPARHLDGSLAVYGHPLDHPRSRTWHCGIVKQTTSDNGELACLRSETPGADGFDPADEDIATTPDNGATTPDNGPDNELTRLRADNARLVAALEELTDAMAERFYLDEPHAGRRMATAYTDARAVLAEVRP